MLKNKYIFMIVLNDYDDLEFYYLFIRFKEVGVIVDIVLEIKG